MSRDLECGLDLLGTLPSRFLMSRLALSCPQKSGNQWPKFMRMRKGTFRCIKDQVLALIMSWQRNRTRKCDFNRGNALADKGQLTVVAPSWALPALTSDQYKPNALRR